jgi:hypothetical protein
MRRIDARRKNASAFRLRFSQSLASRRQRLSQAMERSTIQRDRSAGRETDAALIRQILAGVAASAIGARSACVLTQPGPTAECASQQF